MKLAFFDTKPYDKPGFDEHIAGTDIEIKYFETRLGEDTVQLAKGFDGVCVFVNDTVNEKVINELYDLGVRVIALRCAGFNNVDTKACFGKLHVFRVPAYSPYAVAEHAMALLLTVNRHTNKAYIRTRDFNFSLNGMTGFDLHGKTMGVIGTGKIGKIFIDICRGFRMNVIAYDLYPDNASDINYVELDELFGKSDIISLHCPLTNETDHIINRESLAKMKKGVVLINTSRGGLIETEALIDAIKAKTVTRPNDRNRPTTSGRPYSTRRASKSPIIARNRHKSPSICRWTTAISPSSPAKGTTARSRRASHCSGKRRIPVVICRDWHLWQSW